MRYGLFLLCCVLMPSSMALAAARTITLPPAEETLLTNLGELGTQTPDQLLLAACTLGLARLERQQQDADIQQAAEALAKHTPQRRKRFLDDIAERRLDLLRK